MQPVEMVGLYNGIFFFKELNYFQTSGLCRIKEHTSMFLQKNEVV